MTPRLSNDPLPMPGSPVGETARPQAIEDTAILPRYLTRQPILDSEFRVLGHEFSVRRQTPLPVLPGASSADQNRDELLLAALLDMDYQRALSHKLTLLGLAPESLDNPLVRKLSRGNTVLLVDPTNPTPALLAQCQALSRLGYALAIDEGSLSPGLAPLARQCQYIRVDVGDNDLAALCDRLVRVEGIQGPRLIARNVETGEAYAACRKLGFSLFQGYFFAHARADSGKGFDPGRLRIVSLLNLAAQRAEFPEIEAQFKLDPALTYRILRYINSPAVGLRYPVQSIGHVLLMLGHDQLHRWLTLLLFAQEGEDRRAQALLRTALVRARLAELLGEGRLDRGLAGGLFIAGILSLLDSLLGLRLDQALAPLKLAPAIGDALLRGEGPLAGYLNLAMACEGDDPAGLARLAAPLDLDPATVNHAHLQALIWSEAMDL